MISSAFTAGFPLDDGTINCCLPPAESRTWDWVKEHGCTPEGKPFNFIDYPWVEGICDEWDNPLRSRIWLQFAARLGKTLTVHNILGSAIARRPAPAMIGLPTESIVKQVMTKKVYPFLQECSQTRAMLPRESARLQTRADLLHSTIYTSWSGSPATLADIDPHYKHAGEIDKWTKRTSDEADPLALFLERGREVPDGKSVLESTPSYTGRSRVEKGLLTGTNCRWYAQCPRCQTYQDLRYPEWDQKRGFIFDQKKGGLIFDVDENNRSTPARAFQTARYQCKSCRHKWQDHERKPAIRRGKWIAEGQRINKRGRITGSIVNDGPDASFLLSRLYAPTFTLGDNARELVASVEDDELYQNFLNSWAAKTFKRRQVSAKWDEVAERLVVRGNGIGIVPNHCTFVSCGVDVQKDHFVFVAVAWSKETAGYVVDYGTVDTWDELEQVLDGRYSYADGEGSLPIRMTLVDCRDGNRMEEVVSQCKRIDQPARFVWPSMGSSTGLMRGKSFQESEVTNDNKKGKSRRKRRIEFSFITVNTTYWQTWIHNALYFRDVGNPGSIAFPLEAQNDKDLFDQLMNEMPEDKFATSGHGSTQYVVVNEHRPWDFRDAARYARCGAEVYINGAWSRQRRRGQKDPPAKPKKQEPKSAAATPPGRPYLRRQKGDRFIRRRRM